MFVHLNGLDGITPPAGVEYFDIEVVFSTLWPSDLPVFGEMLNRFFALYADMNQFNQLTLIVQPEGKCIRWKENHSPRLPG
ncbi:TPA: type VI secretion system baseplate subunit TssF [Enterobacter asburiae]|nr:type VI secretion system baseplate subunit TssF [Enterobacter asburiae]